MRFYIYQSILTDTEQEAKKYVGFIDQEITESTETAAVTKAVNKFPFLDPTEHGTTWFTEEEFKGRQYTEEEIMQDLFEHREAQIKEHQEIFKYMEEHKDSDNVIVEAFKAVRYPSAPGFTESELWEMAEEDVQEIAFNAAYGAMLHLHGVDAAEEFYEEVMES